MKKLLLLLIAVPIIGFGQEIYTQEETIQGDFYAGDTKKYLKSTMEPLNGFMILETNEGNTMKFYFVNGDVKSFYGINEWYKSGMKKSADSLINENTKLSIGWYESGSLKCLIYKNMEHSRSGECKWYYENGNVELEKNYIDGKEDGRCKRWYENGNPKQEFNLKNGEYNGSYKLWYQNGQLQKESIYKDGKVLVYSYGRVQEKCWDIEGNEIKCK